MSARPRRIACLVPRSSPGRKRRRRAANAAWLLLALLALGASALAQLRLPPSPRASSTPATPAPGATTDPQSSPPSTTIKVDVNLVTLPVTATDDDGRYLGFLTVRDFRLREDGASQKIAVFRNEAAPVSVGIVVDTSGSMVNKLRQAADALEQFVRTIQPDDDVFLMRFSNNAQLVLDFTSDRAAFDRAAQRLKAGGSTHLYDALDEALDKVRRGRHQKKAILLITDGEDTSSRAGFDEVLQRARASEVLVYCIGIGQRERQEGGGPQGRSGGGSWPGGGRGGSWPGGGSWPFPIPIPGIPGSGGGGPMGGGGRQQGSDTETVDMRVLESIADATGGRAFHLERASGGGQDSLAAITQQISDELRQQYTLGYYSSNSARDGSYRQIELSTTQAGVRLRYRRGYYAPRG